MLCWAGTTTGAIHKLWVDTSFSFSPSISFSLLPCCTSSPLERHQLKSCRFILLLFSSNSLHHLSPWGFYQKVSQPRRTRPHRRQSIFHDENASASPSSTVRRQKKKSLDSLAVYLSSQCALYMRRNRFNTIRERSKSLLSLVSPCGREQHTNAHAGGGHAHTIVGLLQPVCAAIRRADKRSSVHPKKGG